MKKELMLLIIASLLNSCQSHETNLLSQEPYCVGEMCETTPWTFSPTEQSLNAIELYAQVHLDMIESAYEECVLANVDFSDTLTIGNQLIGFENRFFSNYDESIVARLQSYRQEFGNRLMNGQDIEFVTELLYECSYYDYCKFVDNYYCSDEFCTADSKTQQQIFVELESIKRYRDNMLYAVINVSNSSDGGLDYMSPGDHKIWRECMMQLTHKQRVMVAQATIDGVGLAVSGGFAVALYVLSGLVGCL